MKYTFSLLIFISILYSAQAQQSKKIWAKSFLDKKAPELIVEKWLSDIPETKGKFVLIDFWATWCKPCRDVIPELNNFQKTFKDQLIVIGISNETTEKLKPYKEQIKYYSGIDSQKRTFSKYRIRSIPHTVLIDPQGYVRWEGYPLLIEHQLTVETLTEILKNYHK